MLTGTLAYHPLLAPSSELVHPLISHCLKVNEFSATNITFNLPVYIVFNDSIPLSLVAKKKSLVVAGVKWHHV